jgi:diguanylate cyclase
MFPIPSDIVMFEPTGLTLLSTLFRNCSAREKGILGGLLSNILMQYNMHINTTIIDLRHIPIN